MFHLAHIALSHNLAHNRGTYLCAIDQVLTYALKREATLLSQRLQTLEVTLVTTAQAVIIPHNHTDHTESTNKRLANEGIVGLTAKSIIKTSNNHTVHTLAFEQQGALLDGRKQSHTLGSAHSDARMGVEGNDDTLRTQPLGHISECP